MDLRAQVLVFSVQTTSSAHQIRLLGLQLEGGSGSEPLTNLYLNYGQLMEISTREVFSLLSHEMEPPGGARRLSIFFKLQEKDPSVSPATEVDIHVNYTIYEAGISNSVYSTGDLPRTLGGLPALERFPGEDQAIWTAKLDRNNRQIILLNDWIEGKEGYLKTKTHFRFTAMNGGELKEKLKVSQIAFGQFEDRYISSRPMTVQTSGHLGSLIDSLPDLVNNISRVGSPLRIGYFIEWHDPTGGQLSFEVETTREKLSSPEATVRELHSFLQLIIKKP